MPLLLLLAAGRAGASVIEIDEFRLPNGMRVVLAPDSAVPVVTLAMAVPVGARQEERGHSGFAHLFEHLMFEGSAHVRKGEFDRILESHGAENNAWTALDYTFYYEVLPAHALPIAIWLDADRLSALSVSEEGRRNQVDVVKEEKRLQVFNEPYGPLLWIDIASRTFSNWANTHDIYG
ncbi:MAG: insulinase family protein, partial [Elusimicrobiota bacterium]